MMENQFTIFLAGCRDEVALVVISVLLLVYTLFKSRSLLSVISLLYRFLLSLFLYFTWPYPLSLSLYIPTVLWASIQLTASTRSIRKSPLTTPGATSLHELCNVYFDLTLVSFLCIIKLLYHYIWTQIEGIWTCVSILVTGEIAVEVVNRCVLKVVKWSISNVYKDDSKSFFTSIALIDFSLFPLICTQIRVFDAFFYLTCKAFCTYGFHITVLLNMHSACVLPSGPSVANLMRPYYGKKQINLALFLQSKSKDLVKIAGPILPVFLHFLFANINKEIETLKFSKEVKGKIYANLQFYCLTLPNLYLNFSNYSKNCVLESLFFSPNPDFYCKLTANGFLPISTRIKNIKFAQRFSKFSALNNTEDSLKIRSWIEKYEGKMCIFWAKSHQVQLFGSLPKGVLVYLAGFL